MRKPRILQIGSMFGTPKGDEILRSRYEVVALWQAEDQAACLREASDIEVVVTTARHGCSAEVIAALPALKVICSWGVGYDAIDIDAMKERGIQLTTTPDVLSDCVADAAWGLMLASARRIVRNDRYLRAGSWAAEGGSASLTLGTRVSGKKLGILGLGSIGLAIAKRAQGFDMEVRYHNRKPREDVPYTYSDSLLELARWADFLVIATVGGPQTEGIVNREVLQALGPTGIVVNIARGTIIDEEAMIALLENQELGGAGLDVFEKEPQVPQVLMQMDQVVLTPHVASATLETRIDMLDLLMANLEAYFAGKALPTPLSNV